MCFLRMRPSDNFQRIGIRLGWAQSGMVCKSQADLKHCRTAGSANQAFTHQESIYMDNPLDFSGKAVIVTGGGKGIGRGIT
jgi:hypothetical protein